MLPCGRPQRGGGTRVGAPPPGKLRILPRYMGGFFATCSPYVGTFFLVLGALSAVWKSFCYFFSMGSLSASFSTMWGPFHIYFPGKRGGLFCLYGSPPPLRKLLRAPFRGVPRIWEGGAKKYFFQILKFACREATCCAWRSHALNS